MMLRLAGIALVASVVGFSAGMGEPAEGALQESPAVEGQQGELPEEDGVYEEADGLYRVKFFDDHRFRIHALIDFANTIGATAFQTYHYFVQGENGDRFHYLGYFSALYFDRERELFYSSCGETLNEMIDQIFSGEYPVCYYRLEGDQLQKVDEERE